MPSTWKHYPLTAVSIVKCTSVMPPRNVKISLTNGSLQDKDKRKAQIWIPIIVSGLFYLQGGNESESKRWEICKYTVCTIPTLRCKMYHWFSDAIFYTLSSKHRTEQTLLFNISKNLNFSSLPLNISRNTPEHVDVAVNAEKKMLLRCAL